jgi:uncharacterized phage-like protein YoqJ
MTTFAFTGHRPKDLPPGFAMTATAWELDKFFAGKFQDVRFVTGGALGIDSWAAEYAIRQGVPFTLALPFPPAVMSKFWPDEAVDRLWVHIQKASDVQIIHDHHTYDVRAYQLRNEFMVNAADVVLAFWTGKPYGGTANCIRYALQAEKKVINLLPGFKAGPIKEM